MAQGTLTQEEQDQIRAWLKENWKNQSNCIVCATNDWVIARDLIAIGTYENNSLLLGGPVYPHVMCMCRNCGNTVFFNARLTDILRGKDWGKDVDPTKDAEQESG